MLAYVLYGMLFAILSTYLVPGFGYNFEKHHLLSVSRVICIWREVGHFVASAANLVLFALLQKTMPNTAWVVWVTAQGILSFDVDSGIWGHMFFLFAFMASLLYATVEICNEYSSLWVRLYPLIGFTAAFIVVLSLNWVLQLSYKNAQTILELYWMLSFVYFFAKYEEIVTD